MSLNEIRAGDHLVGIPRGREPIDPYRSADRAEEMGKARAYASQCGIIIEKQFIRIQQGLIRPHASQKTLLENAYVEIWGKLSFTQARTYMAQELARTYTELGEPTTEWSEFDQTKEPENKALKTLFQTLDEVYEINLMGLYEELCKDQDLSSTFISGNISPYVGYFIQTALILTREALNPTPLILPEKTRWVPNLYARDKEGKSITQIDAALVSPDLEERLLEPHFYLEQLLKNAGRGRSGTWEMIEIRLLLRSRYNTGPDKNKLKKPLRRDLRGLQERLGILALWWCSGRRKIFPFPEACKLIYVRSPSLRCHTIRFDSAFFEEWIDGLTAKHQVFSNQIHQFKERGRMSEEEFLEAVKLEKELTRNERELDQALEELKMTEEKLIESGSWREKGPHQEAFKTSTTKSFLKTDLVELLEGREISRQELSTIIATKEKRAEITQLIEILNRAQKTTKKREKKQSRRRRKRLEKLQRGKEKGTEVILFERPPEIEQEKPPRPKRHKKEEVEATQGEFFEEEESAS